MKAILITVSILSFLWAVYRILFTDKYVIKSSIDDPGKQFSIGDKVKCVHGRFEGCHGVVSYFNPEAHEDKFCMRVEPDLGERVNPNNWIKL